LVVTSQTSTSIWKKHMIEGQDYIIAPDPERKDEQDAWCVIFTGDYDKVVARYDNIQILEKGTKLSFVLHVLHQPEESGDANTIEFHDHAAEVLSEIIKSNHDQKTMIYINKETGEQVEYE
jgi:hypothetical protein